MSKENAKKQMTDAEIYDKLFYNTVASSTDCTGLIPSQPESDEEAESYEDIRDIPEQLTEQDTEPAH